MTPRGYEDVFNLLDEYFNGKAIQKSPELYKYLKSMVPGLTGIKYARLMRIYKQVKYGKLKIEESNNHN